MKESILAHATNSPCDVYVRQNDLVDLTDSDAGLTIVERNRV